jgi:hypothetical protein
VTSNQPGMTCVRQQTRPVDKLCSHPQPGFSVLDEWDASSTGRAQASLGSWRAYRGEACGLAVRAQRGFGGQRRSGIAHSLARSARKGRAGVDEYHGRPGLHLADNGRSLAADRHSGPVVSEADRSNATGCARLVPCHRAIGNRRDRQQRTRRQWSGPDRSRFWCLVPL